MSDAARTADFIEPPGQTPASATMGLAPGVVASAAIPAPQVQPKREASGGAAVAPPALPGGSAPASLPPARSDDAPPPKMGVSRGFVDPANPHGLPPEAATVIGVIRSAEGTAQRQGFYLYGGQPFTPGYEHPAREGWQGNPAADTHAAGPGQWQPGTWDDEVKKAQALGLKLDFGRGADQDWAIYDRASRLYKNATGHDLAADVKAGRADYSVLGGEWAGLAKGTGSPTLRGWANSASPVLRESAQALTAEAERLSGQYHTDAAELMRLANAAPAGSRERDDAIAKLREREHDYALKYEAIASHPPAMKPVDALSNFGSAASIVGLLGGLFSRRHLTTALAASGAAMKAINENNHEEFQRQYKIWEQQSTTALNMVKLHNEEIRALIDDKKMAVDEKNSRLQVMFQGLGMARQADAMALGAHEKVFAEQANLERATMTAGVNKLAFQQSVAAQLEAKYISEGVAPEEARVRAAREAGIIPSGAGGTSASKNIVVHDKDGKEVFRGAARENKSGGWIDAAGKPVPIPEGGGASVVGTSGNRVQPQIQRLLGSGSQMEAHLHNLAEMPIDASIGVFMGEESKTPDGLAEALKRTIVRKAGTSEASQAMQVEFIGVSRQIAALDAQGAATGLVGLSKQAEGYAPLPTDSPLTVMRKYASLRQVTEQAMNGVMMSGTANPEQKKGAAEILASVKASIPWTIHDINTLQFPPGGDLDKAARAVAERILGSTKAIGPPTEAVSELKAHKDDPVYRQSFDKHFGAGAAAKALGE